MASFGASLYRSIFAVVQSSQSRFVRSSGVSSQCFRTSSHCSAVHSIRLRKRGGLWTNHLRWREAKVGPEIPLRLVRSANLPLVRLSVACPQVKTAPELRPGHVGADKLMSQRRFGLPLRSKGT